MSARNKRKQLLAERIVSDTCTCGDAFSFYTDAARDDNAEKSFSLIKSKISSTFDGTASRAYYCYYKRY